MRAVRPAASVHSGSAPPSSSAATSASSRSVPSASISRPDSWALSGGATLPGLPSFTPWKVTLTGQLHMSSDSLMS